MAIVGIETTESSAQVWKSPLRKLVQFFKASRDRWKVKYMDMKGEHKLMGNQVRAVEKSRQKWRQVAKHYRKQVHGLQRDLEAYKKSAAA